jgi:gas vesicle protein
MAEREAVARAVLYTVAGGLAGAAIAILFAPQSGRQTREDIFKMGQNVAGRVKHFQDDLTHRVETFVEDYTQMAKQGVVGGRDVRADVYRALEASRQVINDKIQQLEDLIGRPTGTP